MPANIDIVAIPSLDTDGWVFSSLKQADYIMAYFLAADQSQSYVHRGNISSFGWLVATYNNEPELLVTEMTKVLNTLFGRYFNNVIVECTNQTNANSPSEFILGIYVEFETASGAVSNISKIAQINGSKFEIINNAITQGK